MDVPEHLWRFSTSEARKSLSEKLSLPYSSNMQDWECEISDASRISEFLSFYQSKSLSEDELFSLMEIIIWSFIDLDEDLEDNTLWHETLEIINNDLNIHIFTVWSLSRYDKTPDFYCVSFYLKEVVNTNCEKYT